MSLKTGKPKVCDFCRQEKCVCPTFVCPIHGKTKAVLTVETRTLQQDKKTTEEPVYKCHVEDCSVKRIKKEMEFL